jgi:hypothetical protein
MDEIIIEKWLTALGEQRQAGKRQSVSATS